MWTLEQPLAIQVGITSYCNAKCPQCIRTAPKGLGLAEGISLSHITLERFKKAFPSEFIKNHVWKFTFGGAQGDPIMNPEVYDITKYVFDSDESVQVNITTNGSIRNEDWWWEFGLLSNGGRRKLHLTFDIDGIDQQTHEYYRRGTELEKVLLHMETFASTNSHVDSQTIVFKHNQDQLEDIAKLARSLGSKNHSLLASNRFFENPDFSEHTDEHGRDFKLERATVDFSGWGSNDISRNLFTDDKPRCGWAENNSISIREDGVVWPCCYLSGPTKIKDVLRRMNPDDYSINNYTVEEILKKPFFKSVLENPVRHCYRHCSTKTHLDNYRTSDIIATDKE